MVNCYWKTSGFYTAWAFQVSPIHCYPLLCTKSCVFQSSFLIVQFPVYLRVDPRKRGSRMEGCERNSGWGHLFMQHTQQEAHTVTHQHKKRILPDENSHQPTGESWVLPRALEGEKEQCLFLSFYHKKNRDLWKFILRKVLDHSLEACVWIAHNMQ